MLDSDTVYNAMWFVLIIFLLGLPIIGAVKIEAELEAHLRRERARLSQFGRTYTTAGQLRVLFLWLALTCLLAWAVFSLAVEGPEQTQLNLGMLLLLTFIGLPGAALILPSLSIAAIGEDAVHMSWLGQRKRLALGEIEHVREYFWLLPPHMRLRGGGTSVYINRWAEGLNEVYQALNANSTLFRNLTHSPSNSWQISRRFWAVQGGGISFFLLLFVGGTTWGAIASRPLKPEDWALVVFLDLFFIVAFGGLFIGTELKPKMPSALKFENDTFYYRFPFKGWSSVPVSAIQEVTQTPVNNTVRSKGISVTTKVYPVMIQLADGTKLTIDERRAVQFGTSTHVLFAQIQRILAQ